MTEPAGEVPRELLLAGPGGRTLAHGVIWIGAFRWSSQVLTWAVTLIVLRILSPRDYGIVGMTTFFIALAGVLSEFGIGAAVVAIRDLSQPAIRQLHTLAITAGMGAAMLSALIAWPFSRWFREPPLVGVLVVLGLSFLLDGFRVVPIALLNRELNYRKASSVDLVRALAAAATALLLAVSGAGYWTLVGSVVAGSAAASAWAFRLRRVSWEWPRLETLAAPLRYCRHLIVSRLAYSGYQNADFLIAGHLFGSSLLGQYNLAWTIASLPGEKLTNVITAAATPFFAAIQHDRRQLAFYYLRLSGFLSLALWPALFGFLLVADLAIPHVLGPQWASSVPLARALILYASVQSISTLNATVLFLTGHSRTGMNVSLLALAVLPPAFYIGGRLDGLNGVAWAWVVMFPLLAAWPLATVLRTLQLSFWTYLRELRRATLMVLTMACGVLLLRRVIGGRVSAPAELTLSVVAGVLVYGLLCLRFAREDLKLVVRTWRRVEGPAAAPPVPTDPLGSGEGKAE